MQFKVYLLTIFSLSGLLAAPLSAQTEPPETRAEFEQQYQERIKKDRLFGVYIPKNLDDAMVQLNKIVSAESQAALKAIPEDSVCRVMHPRLGQWMIHNWGFYEGSRLSHYLRSAGISYPDDMADFLILAYHRHLNAKPYEIKALATYYREKRKKEYAEEVKEGKVIHEEKRPKKKKE